MTIFLEGRTQVISLITEEDNSNYDFMQISIETPRDLYDKNIFECISNEYASIIAKY